MHDDSNDQILLAASKGTLNKICYEISKKKKKKSYEQEIINNPKCRFSLNKANVYLLFVFFH